LKCIVSFNYQRQKQKLKKETTFMEVWHP